MNSLAIERMCKVKRVIYHLMSSLFFLRQCQEFCVNSLVEKIRRELSSRVQQTLTYSIHLI